MAARDLIVRFLGETGGLDESVDKVSEKMGVAGSVFAGFAIVAAGVAGALLEVGTKFEEASNSIAQKTGATGERLDSLNASFRDTMKAVPESMQKVADTVGLVAARTGATGGTLTELSTKFLDLARVTHGDVSTEITAMTSVFKGMGTEVEAQGGTLDTFLSASQRTGVSVQDLADGVAKFSAPLKMMGLDAGAGANLLADLGKGGGNANKEMVGLQTAIIGFSKSGVPAEKGMTDLYEKLQKLGPGSAQTALAVKEFGKKAGPDLANAINSGVLSLDDFQGKVKNTGPGIEGTAKSTETFTEKLAILKNNGLVAIQPIATVVSELLLKFGDILVANVIPAIVNTSDFIVNKVVPAIANFVGWVKQNSAVLLIIGSIIGVIILPALIGLGVQAVISAAKQVWAWVTTKAEAVASAASHVLASIAVVLSWVKAGAGALVNAAIVVAGWLAASTGAIASGIVHVAQSLVVVGSWVRAGVAATVNAIVVVAGWIAASAGAIAAGIVYVAQGLVVVGAWVMVALAATANALVMAAAWFIALGPVGWVIALIVGLVIIIILNWQTISTKTVEIFQSIWTFIKQIWNSVWNDVIKPVIDFIVGGFHMFQDILGKIPGWFQNTVDAIRTVWDGIKAIAAAPVKFIVETVWNNGLRNAWNWVVGLWGGKQLDPLVLNFATGGGVPGSGTGDTVPAMLTPGEHVWTVDEVEGAGGHAAVLQLRKNARGYAAGGPVEDTGGNWFTNLFSNIPNPLADIAGIAARFGNTQYGQAIEQFGSTVVHHVLDAIFGKNQTAQASSGLSGPGGPATIGGNVLAWIATAEALTGVGSSWTAGLATLIQRESGGNPRAINLWDSNAKAGHPSQGLMQTIPSTFAGNHQAGTSNDIYDPVANIAAGINYIKHTYGGIGNVQQANPNLPHRGYRDGSGILAGGEFDPIPIIAHGGEVVLPKNVVDKLNTATSGGNHYHLTVVNAGNSMVDLQEQFARMEKLAGVH